MDGGGSSGGSHAKRKLSLVSGKSGKRQDSCPAPKSEGQAQAQAPSSLEGGVNTTPAMR